jgi:hypothetical protein
MVQTGRITSDAQVWVPHFITIYRKVSCLSELLTCRYIVTRIHKDTIDNHSNLDDDTIDRLNNIEWNGFSYSRVLTNRRSFKRDARGYKSCLLLLDRSYLDLKCAEPVDSETLVIPVASAQLGYVQYRCCYAPSLQAGYSARFSKRKR